MAQLWRNAAEMPPREHHGAGRVTLTGGTVTGLRAGSSRHGIRFAEATFAGGAGTVRHRSCCTAAALRCVPPHAVTVAAVAITTTHAARRLTTGAECTPAPAPEGEAPDQAGGASAGAAPRPCDRLTLRVPGRVSELAQRDNRGWAMSRLSISFEPLRIPTRP